LTDKSSGLFFKKKKLVVSLAPSVSSKSGGEGRVKENFLIKRITSPFMTGRISPGAIGPVRVMEGP
jgi:hypothetical protein